MGKMTKKQGIASIVLIGIIILIIRVVRNVSIKRRRNKKISNKN